MFERGTGRTLRFFAPDWLEHFYKSKYGADQQPDKVKRADRRDRIEEIELRNKELDLGVREGKLVDVEELIRERVRPFCEAVRTGAEMIHRFPEAQRIVIDQLEIGIDRLQANGSTHYLTGDRTSNEGDDSGGASGRSAKPPRVRKEVRKNAGGRPKGRGKVS